MHETYVRIGPKLKRRVQLAPGKSEETSIVNLADDGLEPRHAWWQSLLRGSEVQSVEKGAPLRIVDAFCGSGGLGLGMALAAQAVNRAVEFPAIIDTDAAALEIHSYNMGAKRKIAASAASLVDFHVLGLGDNAQFGYEPETVHADLDNIGSIDVFIAGPPCQGHSNLNNHTRRQDPRNDLYVTAVALGVALKAKAVIIENVPTVQNSHSDVVATAVGLLKSAGYSTSMGVIKADNLGAAQRRARHFLVASKEAPLNQDYLMTFSDALKSSSMPLSWAIGDLINLQSIELINSTPVVSSINAERINYLFDHNLYDLPDSQRPDCHKNGTSYTAVYGRMYWDRPAQTITTGFGTPGQGRYVHPIERRLITPREAARIQGFPDWFDFVPSGLAVKRKHLAKWIGDAVHPTLGYAVGLAALSAMKIEGQRSIQSAA
ncbi:MULTISPECIES: DNA cytosine methyltransferase [unclassified Mesorhizobium]|uniref:DNA cytosine methyltransferase n=1 Tax=unclassified Mesorhizobium TaxID=325217 RepID=UPI0015E37824|nr:MULTISPECIES: DNA cytosine methyltransferase [unclassified Mesorhizobium]